MTDYQRVRLATPGHVNVRMPPGVKGQLVTTVQPGQEFEVKLNAKLGHTVDNFEWFPVRANGVEGWMALVAPSVGEQFAPLVAIPEPPIDETDTTPLPPVEPADPPIEFRFDSMAQKEMFATLLIEAGTRVASAPGLYVNVSVSVKGE